MLLINYFFFFYSYIFIYILFDPSILVFFIKVMKNTVFEFILFLELQGQFIIVALLYI